MTAVSDLLHTNLPLLYFYVNQVYILTKILLINTKIMYLHTCNMLMVYKI